MKPIVSSTHAWTTARLGLAVEAIRSPGGPNHLQPVSTWKRRRSGILLIVGRGRVALVLTR
jgi:hypothetical protein